MCELYLLIIFLPSSISLLLIKLIRFNCSLSSPLIHLVNLFFDFILFLLSTLLLLHVVCCWLI